MIISSHPHEESSEMFDAIKITINLEEVLFSTNESDFTPEDETKKPIVKNGNQSSEDILWNQPPIEGFK